MKGSPRRALEGPGERRSEVLMRGTGVTSTLAVPMSDRKHRFQGATREIKQQRGLEYSSVIEPFLALHTRAWAQSSARGGRGDKKCRVRGGDGGFIKEG